jgi:hypothetical protein
MNNVVQETFLPLAARTLDVRPPLAQIRYPVRKSTTQTSAAQQEF